jgi:iron-sulfur cluster insertion protein
LQAIFPLTITDTAFERIKGIVIEEGQSILRAFVQGGGCSGFSYGFVLEDELAEDDLVFDAGAFKLVVDPFSAPLLDGATIDWEDSLEGSRFAIRNPKATATCGCGSSFSV